MKNKTNFIMILLSTLGLMACTQTTPSMMNTSRVELARETTVEQIPVSNLNDATMSALANQYHKYGNGPMDLTMTYDPAARDFTAMRAVNELKRVQTTLKRKGVNNLSGQTLAIPEGKPSLMVSFDMVSAHAPSDCMPMPGMYSNETGRFLGDYKFGCGVETAFSQQIARPSDLKGNSELDMRTARRDATKVENYMRGEATTKLDGIERADLSSE